jgi:UDP-3-O-[3-hydroxymyristoyl] glucosamine N-acyltransferase
VLNATLQEQEIRRVIGVPGDGDWVVEGVGVLQTIEDRRLYFINHNVAAGVYDSLASREGCIVIVQQGSELTAQLGGCRVLEVAEPRAAIAKVLKFIQAERRQTPWIGARKVAPTATISPLAVVGCNVEIGEGAVVEAFCSIANDVAIGRNTIIRAGSRICERVLIGEESVIGANSVIGTEGFGFVREAGNKIRIPHLGGTVIGSHVEIGALSVVQSGTLSPTVIEDGAKIDDHVQVSHNVRIGRNASLHSGVVVGGSAVIEPEAWVGINASLRNGRRVGARALVGMDVSVQDDLAQNTIARSPRPRRTDRAVLPSIEPGSEHDPMEIAVVLGRLSERKPTGPTKDDDDE